MKKTTIIATFILLAFVLKGLTQTNVKIMIAGKSSGTISIKELNDAKRITLNTDTIKIISFKLSCIVNGFFKTIEINSDSLNAECYNILNKQVGKKIIFEDIKGIVKTGKNIYIGSIAFKVTE
ncbi:MAG: hypothetical protein HY951_01680 [Bacteroidia bacterium]|nr:hypothetical protein [Bacteroidia bacterium]